MYLQMRGQRVGRNRQGQGNWFYMKESPFKHSVRLSVCLSVGEFTLLFSIFRFFRWEGKGMEEVGKDKATGVIRVRVDPKFYRPTEVVSALSLSVCLSVQVSVHLFILFLCDSLRQDIRIRDTLRNMSHVYLCIFHAIAF